MPWVLAVVMGLAVAACGSPTERDADTGDIADSPDFNSSAISADSSDSADSTDPTSSIPSPVEGDSDITAESCAGLRAETAGTVEVDALVETSGLAGSRRHPGIVWAHNDSGQRLAIYALGSGGTHVATFGIEGVDAVDIEDMAVHDGSVYLADIGDNDAERDEVAVYRFDEPDPASGGATITGIEVFRFRYPGGPRDAEAFAVDPLSGDLVIVEKAFGFGPGSGLLAPSPATVFVAPVGELSTDRPFELLAAGAIPLDELAKQATALAPADAIFTRLGVEGVATATDIRADGGLIAIRTYATVWLFQRGDGESVAQALASTPCEAPSIVEEQGEAVAFLEEGTAAFVTVSEGSSPAWNVTSITP